MKKKVLVQLSMTYVLNNIRKGTVLAFKYLRGDHSDMNQGPNSVINYIPNYFYQSTSNIRLNSHQVKPSVIMHYYYSSNPDCFMDVHDLVFIKTFK